MTVSHLCFAAVASAYILVAIQLERHFTKDEILEMYLNQIFLGVSAHGVEAAARHYFGKGAAQLALAEAATLAALPKSAKFCAPRLPP